MFRNLIPLLFLTTSLNAAFYPGGTNINYSTNIFGPFTNAGTFYISTNGSDVTGVRGRIDAPFFDLSRVMTNFVVSKSAIALSAGEFARSNSAGLPPVTALDVAVYGVGKEATRILDFNPSDNQFGQSQVSMRPGWSWENLTFDLVNPTVPNYRATYLGIPYSNTNALTNIFRNVNFIGGNDVFVYANNQNGSTTGTTNLIVQIFENCNFECGWDAIAAFQFSFEGVFDQYDNFGGNPSSIFIFKNCFFDFHTNKSSSNIYGQLHLFNAPTVPSLHLEDCHFNFVGGLPGAQLSFGGMGLIRHYALTNESLGLITNSTLFIKNVHMDLWGTNIEDPVQIINAYKAVSTNVYVENFTWRSNGVPFKYETTTGIEMSLNLVPFANIGISSQSTNYTGAVGPFPIRVWAHNQSTPGFGINTSRGEITNLVAGYYAISFSADIMDLDSTTGGNFNARLYTNGVAAGSTAYSDIDEQITTLVEINVTSVNRLNLPPQVFWLPTNSVIDLRIGMSTTAGFFVRSAVLDVVRR